MLKRSAQRWCNRPSKKDFSNTYCFNIYIFGLIYGRLSGCLAWNFLGWTYHSLWINLPWSNSLETLACMLCGQTSVENPWDWRLLLICGHNLIGSISFGHHWIYLWASFGCMKDSNFLVDLACWRSLREETFGGHAASSLGLIPSLMEEAPHFGALNISCIIHVALTTLFIALLRVC